MPQIKTYTVIRPDGSKLGPFSLKGLLLQYHKGNIRLHDMVESEDEGESLPLEHYLDTSIETTEEKEATPSQEQTKPPAQKEPGRRKTPLPPLKEKTDRPAPADQSPANNGNSPHSAGTFQPTELFPPTRQLRGERASMALYMAAAITIILSILHLSLAIGAKSEIVYPEDVQDVMFNFNNSSQTIDIFYITGIIALAFCFFCWLPPASENARVITRKRYQRSKASIILAFIIPVINIWEGYAQMRSLLNASLNPEKDNYRQQRLSVAVWWLLFWTTLAYNAFRLSSFSGDGDLDSTLLFLTKTVNTDLLVSCFVLLTAFLVYQINVAQRAFVK